MIFSIEWGFSICCVYMHVWWWGAKSCVVIEGEFFGEEGWIDVVIKMVVSWAMRKKEKRRKNNFGFKGMNMTKWELLDTVIWFYQCLFPFYWCSLSFPFFFPCTIGLREGEKREEERKINRLWVSGFFYKLLFLLFSEIFQPCQQRAG